MKYAVLYENGRVLERVRVADTYFTRLRGLMGQRNIKEGLLLYPCAQVHTYFMREPIDVVYLDRGGQVLSVVTAMEPGKLGWYIHGAVSVLELPAHHWSQLNCGNIIQIEDYKEPEYVKAIG